MAGELEYDADVRRRIAASVAGFALIGLALFCAPPAEAQIHGTPTSVTSIGFGGHFDRAPGTPASVTSLGPNGYGSQNQFHCCFKAQVPQGPAFGDHHRHHHPVSPIGGPVYAVPYYYPVYVVEPEANDMAEPQPQADYPSGPTVFDHRASGESSLAAEAALAERLRLDLASQPSPQPEAQAEAPAADSAPVADQPQTVLVFKDGHQLEVQNYAIVGNMLYDLTPGHHGKIAIADLDVAATAKQNDDRGIDFHVPAGSEAN
jgi:hypothetical protein